jgi:hypothetical protein
LTHITKNSNLLHIKKVFPHIISNKRQSHLYYEGP